MPKANELVCDFLQMQESYIYMSAYVYVHVYIYLKSTKVVFVVLGFFLSKRMFQAHQREIINENQELK